MVTITKTVEVEEEISKRELRELLIAQIIDHGPQHFGMSSWFYDRDGQNGYGKSWDLEEAQCFPGFNECGTTACLAGHAAHLAVNVLKMPVDLVSDSDAVGELFGLDDEDPFSSASYNWPDVMRDAYHIAHELGDNNPVAEWRAALAYLISLRDQDD